MAALTLLLGAAPAAGAEAVEHTVARGHTLTAIARRYRTTINAIREVNGLKPGQLIHPGDTLIIPARGKEAEAAKRAAAARKAADKDKAEGKGKGKGKAAGKSKVAGKNGKGATRDDAKGYARKPKRPGFVRMVRGAEQLDVQLLTRHGKLVPKALPKVSRLLRSPAGSIPIDPRLATLIGMVSNHFGGRTIRVVSGYRPYSPTQYTPHSNHNVGRAMDFSVEGVPNHVVRDFCRTFRNAGVGYYPNSTFVHLDVRSSKVYWVDYSRPGEPPRYDRARGHTAADEAARDVPQITKEPEPETGTGSVSTPSSSSETVENKDVTRVDGLR